MSASFAPRRMDDGSWRDGWQFCSAGGQPRLNVVSYLSEPETQRLSDGLPEEDVYVFTLIQRDLDWRENPDARSDSRFSRTPASGDLHAAQNGNSGWFDIGSGAVLGQSPAVIAVRACTSEHCYMKIARLCRTSHRAMSKRALSPTPSPASPRKRRNGGKPPSDQSSLDSFFKLRTAVTSPSGTPTGSSSSGSRHKQPQAQLVADGSTGASPSIADDEALARKLAAEDGLNIEALRTLEKGVGSSSASISRKPLVGPEDVIDVDLLDDSQQEQPTGSSANSHSGLGSARRTLRTAAPSGITSSPTKLSAKLGSVDPEAAAVAHLPLDVDPLAYALETRPPPWPISAPAPYSFLAHTLSTLSATRSRISILNTLTNSLRTIIKYHPASLPSALYLLSNSLSPPYSPLELGLGPSIISKAIQDVSGLSAAALKRLYNTTGDPGPSPLVSHVSVEPNN